MMRVIVFYDAVTHQMEITGHAYLKTVPKETLPCDSLRLLVQGEQFKDQEWADDKQFAELVKKVSIILAVIDTKTPENGYTFYFANNDGELTIKHPHDEKNFFT